MITPLPLAWLQPILAAGARSEGFVKGFREGTLARTPYETLLGLAAVTLAIVLVLYIAERFKTGQKRKPTCNERKLFRELCRLHRLNWLAIRRLKTLARLGKLTSRSEIFLRPELFAAADDAALKLKLFGAVA